MWLVRFRAKAEAEAPNPTVSPQPLKSKTVVQQVHLQAFKSKPVTACMCTGAVLQEAGCWVLPSDTFGPAFHRNKGAHGFAVFKCAGSGARV